MFDCLKGDRLKWKWVLLLVWEKMDFNIFRYFLIGTNAQHSSRELLGNSNLLNLFL
ncbi:MAG: hypothetical protein ACP5KZ_08185 [bacterium]